MPLYIVEVPEIHLSIVEIEVNSPQEALKKVRFDREDKEECYKDECFFNGTLNASKENPWIVKNEYDEELLVDCG